MTAPLKNKPKILLIDLPVVFGKSIQALGYAATQDTFGQPIDLTPSDSLTPITFDSVSIPDHEEQELIFLSTAALSSTKKTPESPGKGIQCFWQSNIGGFANPRPLSMTHVRQSFDRIQAHGGAFVVFTKGRVDITYTLGALDRYNQVSRINEFTYSNFDFLACMQFLTTENRAGNELQFQCSDPRLQPLIRALSAASDGARYHCTLVANDYRLKEYWTPIAKNKYGDDVAGLIYSKERNYCVLVLPEMPNAHLSLSAILDFLGEFRPNLFPDAEGAKWVHRPEYEVPAITALLSEEHEVIKSAEQRIAEIHSEVEALRENSKNWYQLLNGTGDELVAAVIEALNKIGFQKVIDVDSIEKASGNGNNLREDLQIKDQSPILIVDIKGVGGTPSDEEANQAEKHALMRMREWKTHDVKPLTIINSQRHLPPVDRNQKPYRDEIVGNALQTGLGLMTTWDIFILLRNMERLNWTPEQVRPIFYGSGRIKTIPVHYKFIGNVDHVWENTFGFQPQLELRTGYRLSVLRESTFDEFTTITLQVNEKPVEIASPNSKCGVALKNAKQRLKSGDEIYLCS